MTGRCLLIVRAGRRDRRAWDELCADYRQRIERWIPVQDRLVRAGGGLNGRARAAEEARALAEMLPEPCWSVALDRRGKTFSSTRLAEWLGRRIETWPHPIAFLVGSDVGLDPDLLDSVRTRLSFGPATLPHQLARLLLYEQLYRALSIRHGIKYHREPLTT